MKAKRMAGGPNEQERPGLDALGRKIQAARRKQGLEASGEAQAPPEPMGAGWRIASELLTAVVVLTALGWGIDYLVGSTPWVMIVFLFVGAAVGINNAVRMTERLDQQMQARHKQDNKGKE